MTRTDDAEVLDLAAAIRARLGPLDGLKGEFEATRRAMNEGFDGLDRRFDELLEILPKRNEGHQKVKR
jgi:hypothetical protein